MNMIPHHHLIPDFFLKGELTSKSQGTFTAFHFVGFSPINHGQYIIFVNEILRRVQQFRNDSSKVIIGEIRFSQPMIKMDTISALLWHSLQNIKLNLSELSILVEESIWCFTSIFQNLIYTCCAWIQMYTKWMIVWFENFEKLSVWKPTLSLPRFIWRRMLK